MPDLSVSIVNTNSRELLLACLASLAGMDAEIVVLDNASEDDSAAAVRERFPDVRVIAHGLGKEIEPEVVNEFRAGDIRHCYADTQLANELLGFRAEISFEAGMQELLAWLEGQEAADTVDAAREALVARGLAR